jgi:CzcA family heavy metal efflux pump
LKKRVRKPRTAEILVIEKLLRFSVRNTLTLCLISLLWVGIAVWVYFTLPISLLPDLNFPTLSIVVEAPGLTAEEIEKQAALPMESAMSGIYHVARVRSASVANLSLITVQLTWGADLQLARQQVQQKIASVQGDLPPGASVSVESLSNTLGQVQGFILSGGNSLADLHDFAEYHLKPQILQRPGVFDVTVFGGLVKEYAVFVNPSRLEQYDLTLKDIEDALVRNNVASVGGILDLGSQSFAMVPETRLSDLASIQSTIVAVKNNVAIRVKDIGRVAISHLPYRGGAESGDTSGVVIEIIKQPASDVVSVTRGIDKFLKTYTSSMPSGVRIAKYYDQSELVLDSIHGVEEAVLLGALLVGVILLIFLRSWRASVVAFTSIPTALLSALVFMKWLGMSLNIMTLSALAIATGMVIDDAIVIIENVFRHRALKPEAAATDLFIEAAAEVAGPVASSTITTVAIFVPLIFLSGLAGRLFAPVGVVVSIVMTASLLFAFTLIPSVGPHLMGRATVQKGWQWLPRIYHKTLEWALRVRWRLLGIVLLLCAGSVFLLTRLNQEFLPLLDEGSILMTVDTPPDSGLNETLRVTRLLIQNVLHDKDIDTVVAKTGHAPGTQDTDTMNHSDVVAKLVAHGERSKSIEELFALYRKRAQDYPGIVINFTMPLQDKLNDAIGGVAKTIGVKIYGEDLATLQGIAAELAARLAKVPGVVDLSPGSIASIPSVNVKLLPGVADRLGVTREDLNNVVEAMSFGHQATQVRELYKQVPLMMRLEGTDDSVPTLHKDALSRVPLRTADGPYVPLSQVASVTYGEVPSRIEHDQATRVVTVSCNVAGVKNQTIVQAIDSAFTQIKVPPGYTHEIAGSYAAQGDTTRSLAGIGITALLLVATILWIEFQSLRKVILVLLTIPLSTVGASGALWLTHQTLNVSSLIGLVMLVGVVLRNGIVLVDYIHLAVKQGKSLDEAVEEGAQVRLRPILMTALSEILGLAPLALGIGSGSALERPLAIAVIGGLITSTFLTLYVLPVGYRLLYNEK